MPHRANDNINIPWTEAYGDSIEDRAENIFEGNFPVTVTNGNRPAIGQTNEFVLEGNQFVEVEDINFTRPYIGHINPNDEVVYVRSQRYGEIVTGQGRTKSHNVNTDIGYIEGRILKSVYAVTFDQPIINAPQAASCTCAYASDDDCKHILAAQQFLREHNFDDDGGGGGFVDDDDNNIMEDDDFGFNVNEAEVQAVDAFADGTIGARLRQRRMAERQGPRRSTRQRRSTRRSGGWFDGAIYRGPQNQLYEFVEELEKLKL
tara:strand:+ start:100 stop:882 length:783 start_codon:yes stop_codon:yes gene_type:complete